MDRIFTRSRFTITALALAAAATLVGCGSVPKAEPTAQAVLYRTSPVLLESPEAEPVQLTLAAGDNLGLQYVFCWLREIWDCRDGSMILYHTNLPRDQAEAKFFEHLRESAADWLRNTQQDAPSNGEQRSCLNSGFPPRRG